MTDFDLQVPLARDDEDECERNDDADTVKSLNKQCVSNDLWFLNDDDRQTIDSVIDKTNCGLLSDSLEDLVNTFDEKIVKCFNDYDQSIEKLAPVQIRSQEDVINESRMWWTLTGNFSTIIPVEWSQTVAHRLQYPVLNLDDKIADTLAEYQLDSTGEEDEKLAKELDLHSLVIHRLQEEPIFGTGTGGNGDKLTGDDGESITDSEYTDSYSSSSVTRQHDSYKSLMYQEKLAQLSLNQLNQLYIELERLIQEYSETLIQELALRDELDFEKELINTFISLLMGIQNKRRQHHIDRKKGAKSGVEPKYLTTVIPYNPFNGPPDANSLQVLIKILRAVEQDSPMVPTLLTEFILKVLCPI